MLLFPEHVIDELKKIFKRKRFTWLQALDQFLPLEIKLGHVTESTALNDLDYIKTWIHAWQKWAGPGDVQWNIRTWNIVGTQRLPISICFSTATEVVICIAEIATWQRLQNYFSSLCHRWPILGEQLPSYITQLEDYDPFEFEQLLAVLEWLYKNTSSNVYPRQLPIAGIDSKWFEKHTKILNTLLSKIQSNIPSNYDIWQRSGLKKLPHLIRLKILDPQLRLNYFSGISDLSITVDDLCSLHFNVTNVFIIENLYTGLSFDDLPGSIVIMGLGYNVDILARLQFLKYVDCYYWGDIDTHGFSILNRARHYMPSLRSLLMDESILLQHKEQWGIEPTQCLTQKLNLLTAEEHTVYTGLQEQRWGTNVRMEQERVAWGIAWKAICDIAEN